MTLSDDFSKKFAAALYHGPEGAGRLIHRAVSEIAEDGGHPVKHVFGQVVTDLGLNHIAVPALRETARGALEHAKQSLGIIEDESTPSHLADPNRDHIKTVETPPEQRVRALRLVHG